MKRSLGLVFISPRYPIAKCGNAIPEIGSLCDEHFLSLRKDTLDRGLRTPPLSTKHHLITLKRLPSREQLLALKSGGCVSKVYLV